MNLFIWYIRVFFTVKIWNQLKFQSMTQESHVQKVNNPNSIGDRFDHELA